ncbi:MAG: DUF2007 domain-containing protein [Candidatus Doudnabacteria bacterium]|nr:DUF2007 domain-containing protein [Candidatus Doudnabacteria bacterium]
MKTVEVYTCKTEAEAKMIGKLLEKHGIKTRVNQGGQMAQMKAVAGNAVLPGERWRVSCEQAKEKQAKDVLFVKSNFGVTAPSALKPTLTVTRKTPLFLKLWTALYLTLFSVAVVVALFELVKYFLTTRKVL